VIDEKAAAEYLPRIFFCDLDNMVFIMEFLESYQLLDKRLYSMSFDLGLLAASEKLGEFMALVHSKTHSTLVGVERAEALTKSFENRALRDLQLAYVFTKAFEESERSAWLREDSAFMAELEEIRAVYNGKNKDDLALCHGDFHPGSVMVTEDGLVKAIDPEFCVYGPPGLDVGSLLSGYVLAYVFHIASGRSCASLRQSVEKVWLSYSQKALESGLTDSIVVRIGEDVVAFTACEVARTSLGFAGVRGFPIEDATVKAKAEEQALIMAHRCLMGRKGKGMSLLLTELDRFGTDFAA
jgi:5-methylthioribose kinase